MAKRGESVAQTRQRIVEAAVRLHGSIGPAATTIAAIADEAGVTRLTVYRHFADADAIFAACSAHWMSQQSPPRPDAWTAIEAPLDRLRAALIDVYRFYREGEAMFTLVIRDAEHVPAAQREARIAMANGMRDLVVSAFRLRSGVRRTRLVAVVGHVLAFGTWRSLCVEQGLSQDDAVDVASTMVAAVAAGRGRQ